MTYGAQRGVTGHLIPGFLYRGTCAPRCPGRVMNTKIESGHNGARWGSGDPGKHQTGQKKHQGRDLYGTYGAQRGVTGHLIPGFLCRGTCAPRCPGRLLNTKIKSGHVGARRGMSGHIKGNGRLQLCRQRRDTVCPIVPHVPQSMIYVRGTKHPEVPQVPQT